MYILVVRSKGLLSSRSSIVLDSAWALQNWLVIAIYHPLHVFPLPILPIVCAECVRHAMPPWSRTQRVPGPERNSVALCAFREHPCPAEDAFMLQAHAHRRGL